ncbi:aminotransferase class I/II-fold pyridoxal phosphate-dependent enzyme [Streptomyces sp. NPDC058092]|uniref:aminotransferase class I/II-fold pyridoxal phosphate-dependent enzyme n=1 Tax=Streptomyces sp. NPDC058092 TaxID=3346336 RepID=UPI0036E6AACC
MRSRQYAPVTPHNAISSQQDTTGPCTAHLPRDVRLQSPLVDARTGTVIRGALRYKGARGGGVPRRALCPLGPVSRGRSRGARPVPLPADTAHGDNVAALARPAGHIRPRLVHLQPSVHNPTGRTMDEHTRRAWAGVLAEQGLYAVEDNAYAELARHHDAAPVSLAAQLPPAATATIGTPSKLFRGGLRLGWIRASTTVIRRLADIKKSVDLSCPVVDQMLAVQLLRQLPEARAQRRSRLRERLTQTDRLLRDQRTGWRWERPAGGSAPWVEIPGADAEATAQPARRAGVLIVPGPAFSAVAGFRHHLRLPFADHDGDLEKALPVLVDCVDRSRAPR